MSSNPESTEAEALRHAVEARESAERALELARGELENLAYAIGHDLRAPLRGISNYATFLAEDYDAVLDDEGKQMLATLPALCAELNAQLAALLEFSRIPRDPEPRSAVDLDEVVDEVLDSLGGLLQGVELRRAGALPTLSCARARVAELYSHLVVNAVTYNEASPKRVELGVDKEGALYVRDNGVGLPPELLEEAFVMFKRLHDHRRFGKSTGAGLSLARRIAEAHGGWIRLESVPGEGTTVRFHLESGARPPGADR